MTLREKLIETGARAIYDAWWGDHKDGDVDPIGRRKTGQYMLLCGDQAEAALDAFLGCLAENADEWDHVVMTEAFGRDRTGWPMGAYGPVALLNVLRESTDV